MKRAFARWSERFCGGKVMKCWKQPTARMRSRYAASTASAWSLLITDVLMPQMGGRELVERLQTQGHDMKVLYVSGYTDDATVYAGDLRPGTAFLQKPFTWDRCSIK